MGKRKIKDRVILEFKKKVKRKYPDAKILLFGSRARGEALKDSDYDFIIVSKRFEGIGFLERIQKIYELWDYKLHADILCYTPEEFEKRKDSLTIVGEAVKHGVEV